MKLPNGQLAVVDIVKLNEYCLNMSHLRGRHKARVFASALSMTSIHAEELRIALLVAAKEDDAMLSTSDEYGDRYIIDMVMRHEGKSATVRSIWIIRVGEAFPRFVSCYVFLA
jgi:hypothetical protein